MHDFEPGYDTYTEKPGYSWDADVAFADVNPADYAALVIPGGRAPEYIRNDKDVQRIIRHFFQQEKPVAQLCHAALASGRGGRSERPQDRGLSRARMRRDRRGREICEFRSRDRRSDGFRARLARPSGLDARIHSDSEKKGAVAQHQTSAAMS